MAGEPVGTDMGDVVGAICRVGSDAGAWIESLKEADSN